VLVFPIVAFGLYTTIDFLTARWAETTSGLRRMYLSNDPGTVTSAMFFIKGLNNDAHLHRSYRQWLVQSDCTVIN